MDFNQKVAQPCRVVFPFVAPPWPLSCPHRYSSTSQLARGERTSRANLPQEPSSTRSRTIRNIHNKKRGTPKNTSNVRKMGQSRPAKRVLPPKNKKESRWWKKLNISTSGYHLKKRNGWQQNGEPKYRTTYRYKLLPKLLIKSGLPSYLWNISIYGTILERYSSQPHKCSSLWTNIARR